MNAVDAMDLTQSAIFTVLIAAAPAVGVAMVVGLVIALFQALTQVQEMTLTFIPKIVAIMVVAALTGGFIGAQIFALTEKIYGHIERGF